MDAPLLSLPEVNVMPSAARSVEARWVGALAALARVSAAINHLRPGDPDEVERTLRLIAASAASVLPGASAVIYTYDERQRTLGAALRVWAGEREPTPSTETLLGSLGTHAIARQRPALLGEDNLDPGRGNIQTAACFPLLVAGQAVGVFCAYLPELRTLGESDLLFLESLANLAAAVIEQTRRLADAQRHLARKEEELNRLRRAGLLISSRLRLEETLEAILQMALEITNAHYGIFRLLDKGGRNLIARAIAAGDIAAASLTKPRVEVLPIDANSVMGWVATHRQPARVEDLRADPWSRIYYPLDSALEMRSELAVPLINASGRLEGVLNLESPTVGAFSEDDSHLLQALATQAVIAIQEARLLDALQEIAALLLTQPCQRVLSRLVELACDLLNGAASAIWTVEEDALMLQAANTGYDHGERLPVEGSLAGQAVLSGQPVRADDLRADPRFHRRDLARAQNWGRALIVPLLSSDEHKPIGAFSVYSAASEPGRFVKSEWDEKVLMVLAHYAALTVHNAARQEALQAAQGQRAIAETFAAVGDVAANLLHTLNNKVGTIPVRIQGIRDKSKAALLADAYLAANLGEIERSACEAMETVRENLAHLHPIHPAPIQVADCIQAALKAVVLPEGVKVQLRGIAHLPAVIAAQQSLTLVFTNLLENAIEAMKESGAGRIVMRGASAERWVEVTISDSGPGIPPELQERIFDLAFSGRPLRGKLGFGLWWVRTLMTRLGGSVSVESDGHHGSAFRLRLPRAEARP